MPRIGFHGVSVGAGPLNLSAVMLAVNTANRVFVARGSGSGIATLLGSFRSTETSGATIPDTDGANRAFPRNLEGKTLQIEIDAGFSVGAPHGIAIVVQSLNGSQDLLYEWSGRLPMTSSLFGGYSIRATVDPYNETDGAKLSWGPMSERDMYRTLMFENGAAERRLARAIRTANNGSTRHAMRGQSARSR